MEKELERQQEEHLEKMCVRDELIEAQWRYCNENTLPMFAPDNGICYFCRRDCVDERWSKYYITGCSRCNHTFCD